MNPVIEEKKSNIRSHSGKLVAKKVNDNLALVEQDRYASKL